MANTLPTTLTPVRSNASRENTARVYVNEFAEGYRQRTGDGRNNINTILNLEWVGSATDINELDTHFTERAGYQSFTINATWVTSWGMSTSWLWTCGEWSRIQIGSDLYRLTAKLRREFDLV